MRILNVGLERMGKGELSAAEVIHVLGNQGILVHEWRVAPKGRSEPTFIAVTEGASIAAVTRAAMMLDQDAIAAYDVNSFHGFVAGPHAERWSPFKAEYFQVL